MIAYFDSSALVKLLVAEPGSEAAAALWDGAAAVLTSRVAYAEVRAALATAWRARRLSAGGLAAAKERWEPLWDGARAVEVTAAVARAAGDLAEEHGLSGFDAVHLASALLLQSAEVVVATWDVRLHAAAEACGVRVLPARL